MLTDSGKSKLGFTAAHADLLDKMTELDIDAMMDEFDSNNVMYPMFKRAKMYARQVTALLQFLRSTLTQNWMLHSASLEQICICCCCFVLFVFLCIKHIKLCSEYSRIYGMYALSA